MDFLSSVIGRMNGFLYRCRADENYTMLEMMGGVERVTGYPADDIIGNARRSFSSIMYEDDLPRMDTAVGEALAARTDWSLEYRFRHRSGELVWVSETGGGVWDDKGELLYLEGSIIHIGALYQRLDEQTAELRAAASRTSEVIQSLRYLKILAVNASIEAARAGEAGAGFAELASQMRQLANSSEEAARAISDAKRSENRV
jgi:PAS domain S-box-containing protein